MKESVGFIGLGNMGLGMAKNLLKAGFPVIGFDVRTETIEQIRGLGGQAAGSPFEVAQKARVSILVVLNLIKLKKSFLQQE
jgi:3-hydroxyisobutyrate dehydrogenase-like beta-hydroxyacid dehydrogenase